MRPLYDKAQEAKIDGPGDGHAGLWFDKFCDRWSPAWSLSQGTAQRDGRPKEGRARDDQRNPKEDWIRTVTRNRVGSQELLQEAASRIRRLVRAHRGRVRAFRTEGRFITGIGRSHPVENGFAWHPTLGVPYLPGSSVKGLLRAWARAQEEEGSLEQLFGPKASVHRVGSLVLLDAIPVEPVNLEADVMTPHYAGWTEQDPPGDWKSPVPVPFLTTAAENAFLFAVLPRVPGAEGQIDQVMEWLEEALCFAGAGAKTAVGYGRFVPAPDVDARLEKAEAEARAERERMQLASTPAGRWQLELRAKTEDEVYEAAKRIEQSEGEEDRRALAEALGALGYLNAWCKGKPLSRCRPGSGKLKELGRKYRELLPG